MLGSEIQSENSLYPAAIDTSDATDSSSSQRFPGSPSLAGLTDERGLRWERFRHELVPRFAVVWADIGMCWTCLLVGLMGHCMMVVAAGNVAGLLSMPIAAVWMGYWIAALICFMHEAAHFNIHPSKTVNDRLANLILCPLAFEEIGHYRSLHWQHHLHLGDLLDTEVSYRRAPTWRFMLEALTGIHVLRVLSAKSAAQRSALKGDTRRGWRVFAGGAVLHGTVLVACLWFGLYSTALAWVVAAGVVFPFFGTMRQLLEHRGLRARGDVDYSVVEHGPVNRMFGCDFLSRTFGAAGFNRHLLHHWCPSVSYTAFDQLEHYFMRSRLAGEVEASRATYWQTLRELVARAENPARR